MLNLCTLTVTQNNNITNDKVLVLSYLYQAKQDIKRTNCSFLHVVQDLLTLPKHLRSPVYGWNLCYSVFSFLYRVLNNYNCLCFSCFSFFCNWIRIFLPWRMRLIIRFVSFAMQSFIFNDQLRSWLYNKVNSTPSVDVWR